MNYARWPCTIVFLKRVKLMTFSIQVFVDQFFLKKNWKIKNIKFNLYLLNPSLPLSNHPLIPTPPVFLLLAPPPHCQLPIATWPIEPLTTTIFRFPPAIHCTTDFHASVPPSRISLPFSSLLLRHNHDFPLLAPKRRRHH